MLTSVLDRTGCNAVCGMESAVIIPPPPRVPKVRKRLSSDALFALLKTRFATIPDHRNADKVTFPLADVLQAGFALFSLKDPSLLAFEDRQGDENLHTIYRIGQVPCDTQMRAILDPVDPETLRPMFNDVLREVQRGKVLEDYVFFAGAYLLSLDGTGYFSSKKIHCPCCQEKVNKQTGEITYQHQMLAAAIVHPDQRAVFPLAPEPIQKVDGDCKNDCERNAAKRLLPKIRAEHPHMKFIVVEDGLASNAPHLRLLRALNMHFLVGAKPGDHAFLETHVSTAYEQDRITTLVWQEKDIHCELSFVNDLPLNESNQDLRVNYLHYAEYGPDGEIQKCFSWVTDLHITRDNARLLMRGARARWKIENETFNTLKNQGYHYEHNFGHGEKHLSVVMAMLMMLAFLVDQVQQRCCPLFQAVLVKVKSKRMLWDRMRSHFYTVTYRSMQHLYEGILYRLAKKLEIPTLDGS
jgi:hypothetical protein